MTAEHDPSQKKGLRPNASRTSWFEAKLDAVSADASRFRWFMIASGVVALVWVGFVGAVVLRSAPPPEKVAALEPLALLPPAADASDSSSGSEPADAPKDASDEAGPTTAAPGNVAPPRARKATPRPDAATSGAAPKPVPAVAPPPPKLITVTVRTFHPPVISWFYKGMVADKMKEEGLDARLEAKVRNGQQLTKEDLASVPKPVMEKINAKVVAYGQPPLYTDTTTTVLAAR